MSEVWNYPVIVGPTAGGKTALGVELAHRFASQRQSRSEVVTADAYQIYRDLTIGTAKPTIEERRGIPHHLLDLVGLKERFTVHDWLGLADPLIAEMEANRITPVVVGGTNLYIKALLDGLFSAPEPSAEIKARLEAQIEAMDQPDRRAMLAEVDPKAYERIDGADLRRTRRALEVYLQTGTPITDLQQQWESSKPSRPEAVLVGLDWPTALINSRINQRVKQMIEMGLVDEARAIFDADGFGDQSREAIGYKQLIAHFEGRCTLDEAIERIKIDTRRFAKNQRTWLKRLRRRPGTIWLEAHEKSAKMMADEVMQRLELL
ncbi:MAG: tRNA (adenosine(37)-N6)-dimethylallyltransferase MiaA [Phycisphaerales bacterium]